MKLFHPTSIWLKFNNQKKLNDPNLYWLQHPEVEPLEPQQKWVPSGHQPKNHMFETLRLTRSTKTPSKNAFVLSRLFFVFFLGGGGQHEKKTIRYTHVSEWPPTPHGQNLPAWWKSLRFAFSLTAGQWRNKKSPNMSDMNMVKMMNYKACQINKN